MGDRGLLEALMCEQCWAAFKVLAVVTDAEFADYFLWNKTPYPFGEAEDVAPKLLAEAVRTAIVA